MPKSSSPVFSDRFTRSAHKAGSFVSYFHIMRTVYSIGNYILYTMNILPQKQVYQKQSGVIGSAIESAVRFSFMIVLLSA